MAIGNTGVSSLLRSANASTKALSALEDVQQGNDWKYGMQDQAAYDKYSSYLKGRYDTLSKSGNPTDLTQALGFQDKAITTARTFRSNQIQLQTLGVQEGTSTDANKLSTLKNLAIQAYQEGDVQNYQQIEGLYNSLQIKMDNEAQAAATRAANGAASAARTAASNAVTQTTNKNETALAATKFAFEHQLPLVDPTTGQVQIDAKTGGPKYITAHEYAVAQNTFTGNKASDLIQKIQSGDDKNGTAQKDLTALTTSSEWQNGGFKLNYKNGQLDPNNPITQETNQGLYNTLSGNNQGVMVRNKDGSFQLRQLPQAIDTTKQVGTDSNGFPIFATKDVLGGAGSGFNYARKASPNDPNAPTTNAALFENQRVDNTGAANPKGDLVHGFDPYTGREGIGAAHGLQHVFAVKGKDAAHPGTTSQDIQQYAAQGFQAPKLSPFAEYSPSAISQDLKDLSKESLKKIAGNAEDNIFKPISNIVTPANRATFGTIPGLNLLTGLSHLDLNAMAQGGIQNNGIFGRLFAGIPGANQLGNYVDNVLHPQVLQQRMAATIAKANADAHAAVVARQAQQQAAYNSAQATHPTNIRINPATNYNQQYGSGPIAHSIVMGAPNVEPKINQLTGFGNELTL